jgi:phage I-like protein
MASLRRKSAPDVVTTASAPVAGQPSPVTPQPDHAATNALTAQLESLRHAETLQQQQQQQAALVAAAEQRRQSWLASSRTAQENFSALPEIHRQVDTTKDYFRFMDHELDRLQSRQHPTEVVQEMRTRVAQDHQQERPQPVPPPSRPLVSAPVSREPSAYGGNSPTRIRLSAEQIEVAKRAGITEAEYAKQLMKLNEMKANGEYSERR